MNSRFQWYKIPVIPSLEVSPWYHQNRRGLTKKSEEMRVGTRGEHEENTRGKCAGKTNDYIGEAFGEAFGDMGRPGRPSGKVSSIQVV
jgi:hypothetical protein